MKRLCVYNKHSKNTPEKTCMEYQSELIILLIKHGGGSMMLLGFNFFNND